MNTKFTKHNFLFLLVLLIMLSVSSSQKQHLETKVPYRDCGSPLGYLTRLEIIPTCQTNICTFKRGETATLITDFVPKVSVKELKINVYHQDWLLNIDSILWHNKVACGQWNVTCPIEAYDTVYSVFHMRIPKELPSLKLHLKVVALGDGDVQLLCHSAPLDIQ